MPLYKSRMVLELVRNLKAFVRLEAGVARGEIPDPERMLEQTQRQLRDRSQQVGRLQKQLKRQPNRPPVAEGPKANGHQNPKGGFRAVRKEIAARYLSGSGLEIGALHQPLAIPSGVTVRYVDRMSVEQLREQYPELSKYDLARVDIVDDGEVLSSISDASVDFVIANHMMEHCQDPIGSLENHLRVLKPGGVLYISVPDKRFTFDRDRLSTPLEHMVRDYDEGPVWSKRGHFEEWARLMERVPADAVAKRTQELVETDFSIHFHVWTRTEFLRLILHCQEELHFPFEIELFQKNETEIISILRKLPAD